MKSAKNSKIETSSTALELRAELAALRNKFGRPDQPIAVRFKNSRISADKPPLQQQQSN
jgi:hypothetical protein